MIESKLQRIAGRKGPAADWQVFGVGSPHGDDQAGWLLAHRVAEALGPGQQPQILRTPSELLLPDDLPEQVIICDGCRGGSPVGSLRVVRWPDSRFATERFSGSHDLGLLNALELLDRLGRLPSRVLLWTIQIAGAVPGMEISPEVLVSLAPETIHQFIEREFAAL